VEEYCRCRPCCVGSVLLWKQVIAYLARTRSFSGVVGKTCILHWNALGLPNLVELCAGAKNTRVQCFAKEMHMECTVAGRKVVLTCRCISTLRATGLVYVAG